MKNPEIDKFVEDKKQEFNLNVIKPIDELMKECIDFGIKIGREKSDSEQIKFLRDKGFDSMANVMERLDSLQVKE